MALHLLESAIASRPANAGLRLKLAYVHCDRYEFAKAAVALETALALEPSLAGARVRLARCYSALGRNEDALRLLDETGGPEFERVPPLLAAGRDVEAEAELRAILADDPHHRPACRQLCKLLRRAGRTAELLQLCETLSARGAGHAQLLYVWGTALALNGRHEEAGAILVDPSRIAERALPVPDGFADIAAFNAALAEEILASPYRLTEFPTEDEANRGSSRVHALFTGRRPDLVRQLLGDLQRLICAYMPPRHAGFDPWARARPSAACLNAWALIQSGSDYEEWHSHPGGWLSGVYYVRVPASVSAEGAGPGCIEFGPPRALARAMPGYAPAERYLPVGGHVILAPSHYAHRTIPTGASDDRISFAFDVVPCA